MDTYESMLQKREHLLRLIGLSGRQDLLPFVGLAVFSGDERLYQDLLTLANDRILLTQPELHPFLPAPLRVELPGDGIMVGAVASGSGNLLLPVELFGEGLGIFGTTGTGKTMLIAWLVRQLVLEEITDAGYEYLARLQVAARRPGGKGGYLHQFWQHKVAE